MPTADVVERVTALAEAAHTQVETWRELASRSPHRQDAVRANEATVATLCAYSPRVVPGLLQTADYARRVLALTDITGPCHPSEMAGLSRLPWQITA